MNGSAFRFAAVNVALAVGLTGCGRPSAEPESVGQVVPSTPEKVSVPPAVPRPPAAPPRPVDARQEKVNRVSRTLMAALGPLPDFDTAPEFRVLDSDDINAFATARLAGEGVGAKVVPVVVVVRGLLDKCVHDPNDPEGDDDRLALVIGHEISHLRLGHVTQPTPGSTDLVQTAFGRAREVDADTAGAELALRAGYSIRRGRTAFSRLRALGLNYSSFEGLGVDHPSWDDRMTVLDKGQANLWKAMAAFQNGVFFLAFEQYGSAETCFAAVTREFPKCPEGWANLGAARLMRYCDGLKTDDLRGRGIGQPAVAAFYQRPASLEGAVRGTDQRLWNEAVDALQRSLKLDPSSGLARANLGLAYLLDPSGTRAEDAAKQFREAAPRVASDTTDSPLMQVAATVNASVAERAGGRPGEVKERLGEAETLIVQQRKGLPDAPATGSVVLAFMYNRALLLADSDNQAQRETAAAQFERYLTLAEPTSPWWPLAYERYQSLCAKLNRKTKPKEALASPDREPEYRLATAVKLGADLVSLGEPVSDVTGRLGEGQVVPVVRGTDLVRRKYPALGAELLTADRVLAIFLVAPSAPPLSLRRPGTGAGEVTLRVGMAKAEFEKALAGKEAAEVSVDQAGEHYHYYADPGVGAKIIGDKVTELVVTQMPHRPRLAAK
jgi:tetratricopeptide (TPR) repeat protein